MIEDLDEARFVISESPLEGLVVRNVEVFDSSGRVFVIDIAQRDVLEMWSAARALLPATGRAPCVLATWGETKVGVDQFRRFPGEFGGLSREGVIQRAEATSGVEAVAWFRDRYSDNVIDVWDRPYGPESDVERALAEMRRQTGRAPTENEVRTGIGQPATEESLERWLRELVAHFGAMLEFVVERPPSSIDEAFQLACEQY